MKTNPTINVDDYIKKFPDHTQTLLRQLRMVIVQAAPEAEESISYQMPAYKLHGPLVYFGAYDKHIGFYPGADCVAHFKSQLTRYKYAKGTIQFALDQSIPTDLVDQIVKFRINENLQKKTLRAQGKNKL